MAIYQLKTFDDIVDTILEEVKVQAGDTVNVNRIKRDVNIGYQDIISRKNWRWLDRNVDVKHNAYIATGTVAVTQNSASITFSSAPTISVVGYKFSIDGESEVYEIDTHTAAATAAVLKSPFLGTTATAGAYKVWTDAIPLPTDVSQTKLIRLDGVSEPLIPLGISELRRLSTVNPKAASNPMFYATSDFVDPAPYAAIASLPATSTRASAGLVKTVKFAANVSTYLSAGDRIKITGAGSNSYNGEFEITALSTTTNTNDTITYTGKDRITESSTSDTGMSVTLLSSKAQGEKYRELIVFPSLASSTLLIHVEYVTSPPPLEDDADEPLMPIEDRLALVYFGLYKVWTRMRNPEEATKNLALYEKKVGQMSGRHSDSQEKASLSPSKSYLKRKRSPQGPSNGGAGFFFEPFGGTGSDTAIQAGANHVAIFDSLGNLNYSTSITTTELGYLDGATSNLQQQIDNFTGLSESLASAHIFVGSGGGVATDVAVTGDISINTTGVTSIAAGVIVDADVNAAAGITRSKLATGNNYRILANSAAGVMSENAAITASRAVASDANGQLVASATTATELGYVSGVTSAIQTQLDSKFSNTLADGKIFVGNASNVATAVTPSGDVTMTNAGVNAIAAGVIVNADINASAAIDRTKIASGTNYRILANSALGVMSENAAITASRMVVSDANGQLVAGAASATEADYLDGVTSAIQTQLDSKQSTTLADGKFLVGNVGNVATAVTLTGDVTSTNAGVTSIGALKIVDGQIAAAAGITRSKTASGTNYRILANNATGVMSENAAITASRAVASDANGQLVASATTATELGYVNGVTSAIQTQIDSKSTKTLTDAHVFVGNASNVATDVAMTGDVTISNAGVTAIGANKVTLAQEAQMATASFKGRTTGGVGNVEVLSATQATAILNAVVGDSGAGGTKGLVPAPAAGDAAASKFLKADGTWTAPTGSGDFVGPGASTDNAVVRFDGTTGKLGQNSVVTIDDTGATTGITTLNTSGLATLASATVTGATLLNGTVGLGDASADDISFNGSLATTIPIKTNATYNIGDSTHGVASVYFGSAGGLTTRIVGGATGSSYTLTLPVDDGSASQVLTTNGTGTLSWSTVATNSLTDAHIFVGNSSNIATDVAMSGDITISNTGATAIASGAIVNADVNASAAIDYSKLAALTSANILVGSAGNVATVTPMTGDVTITNAGVTAIGANKVTLAQEAQMATASFKGRNTAAVGNVEVLSATTATSMLNAMVGDSGAGGTKGLVPAPAAGDAAASKFLKADGTWAAVSGTGDVVGPGASTDNAVARFDTTTGKLLQNSTLIVDDAGATSGITTLQTSGLATLASATVTGATLLNGTVGLGDAAGDDISFNGSLATTIPIKTNATYNIGDSTHGVAGIYIGSSGALTTRIISGATGSSYTLTLPVDDGTSNQVLATNGSGVLSWATVPSNTLTSAHILVGNGSNVATDVAVTGDVTISNAGVTAIGSNKVTLGMEAQMATLSFKGRYTGGIGNVEVLTATQATEMLNVFGADAGSGGVKGLVPATVAGDSAKYLKGNGTWAAISGTGDFVGPAAATDNAVVRFDATTGKLGQNSVVTIDDTGATTGITTLNTSGLATLASATVTGATLLNGTVGIGDTSGDDISFNGSLATTIPVKTNATYNIGDSTHGLAGIYIGSSGALTTRIISGATGSSYTLTLPVDDGAPSQYLQTNGSGVLSWASPSGTGDVVGPASSTDNAIVRFDSTTGKLIQNTTLATLDDDGCAVVGRKTFPVISGFINVTAATHKNGVLLIDTGPDGAGGDIDINLPAPSVGMSFTVKDIGNYLDTNPARFVRNASENINLLGASFLLESNGGTWDIYCDGTDWYV